MGPWEEDGGRERERDLDSGNMSQWFRVGVRAAGDCVEGCLIPGGPTGRFLVF